MERKKDVFIVDGVRTPIGNFAGSLSSVRTDDLAALTLAKILERNPSVDPAEISDVILGCANQAGEDNRNVARMASLLAGIPFSVPGETVNRLCASGMSAAIHASHAIAVGNGDLYIAGGVENMTRGPWVISKTSTPFGRDAKMYDSSFGWRFINPRMKELYGTDGMGETAENLSAMYQISREDQDRFSFHSQVKAATANKNGRFLREIMKIDIQVKRNAFAFNLDEFIKPDTTIEVLAKLKPAFSSNGTVTAGNSSGLNDGSAAMLLASADYVQKKSLTPMARIVSSAVVGVEPRIMGIGPVKASQLALQRAGLQLSQMDTIELNEAFAAQSLACIRQLGLQDEDPRINPNGGSIALGHPLGMTGTRLLMTAAMELQEKNLRYALCTMCIGVGQGFAVVIERA